MNPDKIDLVAFTALHRAIERRIEVVLLASPRGRLHPMDIDNLRPLDPEEGIAATHTDGDGDRETVMFPAAVFAAADLEEAIAAWNNHLAVEREAELQQRQAARDKAVADREAEERATLAALQVKYGGCVESRPKDCRCPRPANGPRTMPEWLGEFLDFAPSDDACTVCDHCGESLDLHGGSGLR